MAIGTHAELLTAIAAWTARSDLTTNDDEFIVLCESRVHYGAGRPGMPYYSAPLRIRAMETSADVTVSAQTAALPTGWLQGRRLYLNTNPIKALNFLAPMDFWSRYLSTDADQPEAFTIEGENFVFGPTPDATYTAKSLHYAKFAALSAGVNWLITNKPDVYLYGSLLEAAIFIKNYDEAGRFHALYAAAIEGLVSADENDRHSGAPLMMRAEGSPP